jgi:hypothetical protein
VPHRCPGRVRTVRGFFVRRGRVAAIVERLLIALLSAIFGLVIGLLAPGLFQQTQDVHNADQYFLDAPAPAPTPTSPGLTLVPRAAAPVTSVPPTLVPPTAAPTRTPVPTTSVRLDNPPPESTNTPVSRTFVIRLRGGGDMTVNAQDFASAVNNVKSTGADPADQP